MGTIIYRQMGFFNFRLNDRVFTVDLDAAKISDLVAALPDESCDLNLPARIWGSEVTAESVLFLVEYMSFHNGQVHRPLPRPLISGDLTKILPEWDVGFVDTVHGAGNVHLYSLINLANYLGVRPLVELVSAKIASIALSVHSDQIVKSLKV